MDKVRVAQVVFLVEVVLECHRRAENREQKINIRLYKVRRALIDVPKISKLLVKVSYLVLYAYPKDFKI